MKKRLVMQNKNKIVDKFKRNKNEIERPNASRDKEKSSNSLISALFLQQKIVALKKDSKSILTTNFVVLVVKDQRRFSENLRL